MQSKKKKIEPELLEPSQQTQAREYLGNLMNKEYQPYTGQVFGQYPDQGKLQDLLGSYVNRNQQPLYGLAQGELTKTLQGDYNPITSPYYKAYRTEAVKNEQQAVNSLRRQAEKSGMLQSTPLIRGEADIRSNTANTLNTLLGGMFERERTNQLNSVPEAMTVGQLLEGAPLKSAQAITTISPILKALQEEPLKYSAQQYAAGQEWPYSHQGTIAQLLLANKYPWTYPRYTSGKTGKGAGIGSLLGMGLGALLAPATGGMSLLMAAGLGSAIGGGLGGLIKP